MWRQTLEDRAYGSCHFPEVSLGPPLTLERRHIEYHLTPHCRTMRPGTIQNYAVGWPQTSVGVVLDAPLR